MKKYLFCLLSLFISVAAFADGQMQQTPAPVIQVDVEEFYVRITAFGQGEVLMYVDGVLVNNPFTVARLENEDTEVAVMATAQAAGCLISDETWANVTIPGMDPRTPAPTFRLEEDDFGIWVYAEGEGDIYLFIEGNEVDNPYYLEKGEEDYVVNFEAAATKPGYYQSDMVYCTVFVPHLEEPEPVEQTCAPSISCNHHETGEIEVMVVPSEDDSFIFYRIYLSDVGAYDWQVVSDWEEYEEPLFFTLPGAYMVEAYAIVPGKTQSVPVMIQFMITDPTPVPTYDFMVDGIYYKSYGINAIVVKHGESVLGYQGDIVIPNTVTHYGHTYYVTQVDDDAFNGCTRLTSVSFGNYITAIGNQAFKGCTGLTRVVLGDYVIDINDAAFMNCTALTSVTLGHGVRTIGSRAFTGCSSLSTVICRPAVPPVMENSNCFDCYGTAVLKVYPPVYESYMSNTSWSRFSNIVAEDNVLPEPGDVDGNGIVNVSDAVNLINQLLNSH